jgi:Rrf2 family protein
MGMKTLSRRCKYALRATYLLTRQYQRGSVTAAEIAAAERIPRKFLEAILVQLRNRGIVDSRQGKGGGYTLAAAPDTISIGNVIRAIDGPLAPLPCASETEYLRCPECVDENLCETRHIMRKVRDAVAAILDETTLADACARGKSAAAATTYEI